jgi:type II secretory pathway component PulK
VAILLVVFVVALASIIVVNVAYSTHLQGRLHNLSENALKSEYILKSALNVARRIIKEGNVSESSSDDLWGYFKDGAPIPANLIGVNEPGTSIALEIRPEESKIPLRAILPVQGGEADVRWRDVCVRLFRLLGFDEDQEEDHTGLFPGRIFNSEQLVAALIDYMDENEESYTAPAFASGIESELPSGYFPNTRIRRIGELATIPGFTPARIRRLSPFITVFGASRINLNIAPEIVLLSLHENLGQAEVKLIMEARQNQDSGPFSHQDLNLRLSNIIGEETYDAISFMIGVQSRWFQVLAKADFGGRSYYLRSYLSRAGDESLPAIRSLELF